VITKEQLVDFQKSFEGELHFDDLHKSMYATDASVYRKIPLAVAYPKTENDVQKLVQFAKECKASLVPRAAGTSLAGQCVGDGIIVDVSKHFTNILSVDEAAKTVTVQPGVIRDELNEYLKPYKLFFGPNTSTSNRCMIGGMVGNNSSGTTSIQYGVTRDKILAIRTVLSDGSSVIFSELNSTELDNKRNLQTLEGRIYDSILNWLSETDVQLEIKNQFPKSSIHRRNTGYSLDALLENNYFGNAENDSGFNLAKLLCGSEGTLAFTTEVTLKLDSLPPRFQGMIAVQYEHMNDCMQDVVNAMKHELYTCELMDDVILNCTKNNKQYDAYRFFIKGNPKAILLLELRADTETALQLKMQDLSKTIAKSNLSTHQSVLRGKEIDQALALRKAGLGLLGNMVGDRKAVACIEDTAVALEDLPNYIKEFSELMTTFDQEAVYYAHAGAGELHLRPILNLKKSEDVTLFRNITEAVAKLVKKYQGSLSGEHGDGIVRAEFLKMQVGEQCFQLMKNIKSLFDPDIIFNPGKITDAWPMDENLRYEVDRKEPIVDTILSFEDSGGILRLAEKCNGSGDCRKTAQSSGMLCPSYHATKNEKDSTRARANVLREVLTTNATKDSFDNEALKTAFDLCIGCKACATECPSNVDMATAKAEFLYQYQKKNGISKVNKRFGLSSSYNKRASKFPRISNWLLTSNVVKNYLGVASQRSLPKLAKHPFHKRLSNLPLHASNPKKQVYLLVDEFSNYFDAEIAEDAYCLLTKLGYKVHAITHLDSARAMISKGFLEEARIEVNKNLAFFRDKISDEIPLLGIEPSAILGFRDEYLRLAHDIDSATQIAKNSFLVEEFLASELRKGILDSGYFTSDEKTIKVHVHCHQKSLGSQKDTFDLLNLPQNYKVTMIPSGCCGMAGSFGYEKEHYEVSMKIGEIKLFHAIRKTDPNTIIVANGTSCRHQISDALQRTAVHPITLLHSSLRLD